MVSVSSVSGKALQPTVSSPFLRALVGALCYIVFCLLYIHFSGWAAARIATSEAQLQAIEQIKGTLFVIVTGVLLFVVVYFKLRTIRLQEQRIIDQQAALLSSARHSVAAMCSASLTHDLKNMLMSVKGVVGELEAVDEDDGLMHAVQRQLDRTVAQLSAYTKRAADASGKLFGTCETVAVRPCMDGVMALIRKHPDVSGCEVRVDGDSAVVAEVDRSLLEECLLNLIINAAQAAGGSGRVRASVLAVEHESCVIEVHDDGPGVADDMGQQIFDPCYTTKSSGTGIGLLAVTAFAGAHGGTVAVGRSDLGGACFSVRFPCTHAGR